MRTSARVVEEGADFVGGFGGQNVLELAGLLFDFGLAVHGERVGEETFGEAVAADDVGGALHAAGREFDDQGAVSNGNTGGFERVVTRVHESSVMM